uniref:Uncharacterized protein n=1 Tax=Hemiselmis tepida TaxID=464990 RepID=A0A6T6VYJ1_9CRYP|mmetsp:Transcript_32806/g.84014  ORF Transcript_32806/g.84014 Transcript_32806/m.84014 type:complete len:291 (+) Transcript_32806:48-920(+)
MVLEDSPETPKAVCFFDVAPASLVHFTSKILEAPFSRPVVLANTCRETMLQWSVINPTGRKCRHLGLGGMCASDERGMREIFSKCRTVVISDSWLARDGMPTTKGGGYGALFDFFNEGGTVVVYCEMGVYSIGETLGLIFGCEWSLEGVNHYTVAPTETGRVLLGDSAPEELYVGSAHMLKVAEGEALYIPKQATLSLAEYIREYLGDPQLLEHGEEPDLASIDDEEWVEDWNEAVRSWKSTKKQGTPLAVYRADPVPPHGQGGKLVWVGDRAQEDTGIRSVLAHLFCKL